MKYVIWSEDQEMWTSPLPEPEAAYLKAASAHLVPLSDEGYLKSVNAFLHLGVHSSYVLDGDAVYWCVECDPGLIVTRFSPEGMTWEGFRSPVPNFGGREASEEEMAAFDEDARNPQYQLVFTPWDAQLEEDFEDFEPASEEDVEAFMQAVARANKLNESANPANAKDRIAKLIKIAGEGIVL